MSATSAEQKKAFEFLQSKFVTHETFTKEEFEKAAGWNRSSFKAYFSKQFQTLLIPIPNKKDVYRVSEVFRRFNSWDTFRNHVTQRRRVAANYTTMTFEKVMLFEFFMPLTNEGYLRTSLDALFYQDSIIARLKSVEIEKLKGQVPSFPKETDEQYYYRVCRWVSEKFVGYSISHVNGRFRADELKSIGEASKVLAQSGRYLVDETTAIVRFIFPCGDNAQSPFHTSENSFESLVSSTEKAATDEAAQIRFFFYLLFVQSIVEAVNGEDEIWLLESGLKNRLHIWRVQN